MKTEEKMNVRYRKITKSEFDNKEIEVYVIERDHAFIGELTIHYTSKALASERKQLTEAVEMNLIQVTIPYI